VLHDCWTCTCTSLHFLYSKLVLHAVGILHLKFGMPDPLEHSFDMDKDMCYAFRLPLLEGGEPG